MAKTEYLKQRGTGVIFVATESLELRKDMEPYDGPINQKAPERLTGSGAGSAGGTGAAGAPGGKAGNDPNRIPTIAEAISLLDEDGYTKNGLPKVEALTELLGFEVTSAERDAAFEMFQKANKG